MGLFGAMTTSVAGLTAQSFALENISGNIANSQTTAYKRIDTTFADIVQGVSSSAALENSGSVQAISRPMNSVGGPVAASGVSTNMAINGDGFFQVQSKTGESDGTAIFSGTDAYTRRGDFTMDKEGYLVNGAGMYLKAIPIDPATGNTVGDTASLLKLSTGYLKANATTVINYNANLPATPSTGLLDRTKYTVDPTNQPAAPATSAQAIGAANFNSIDLSANANNRFSFRVNDGANAVTVTLDPTMGTSGKISLAQAVSAINTQLAAASPASTVTASVGTGANAGKLVFTNSTTGSASTITIDNEAVTGTGVLAHTTDLGFNPSGVTVTGTAALGNGTQVVQAQDNTTFLSQSLEGSSTTCYTSNGTAVNVEMRWAKVNDSPATWNLFYQSDANATGSATMWTNSGQSVIFNSAGAMSSPTSGKINIPNLTVGTTNLGSIDIKFNTTGLTQYDSAAKTVNVSTLNQDGYTSGSMTGVGVDDQGRVTASYSNGQQVPVAAVPLYKFNGEYALKRESGGVFMPTDLSGSAVKMASTSISGASLEGSNTDIAAEFSKMIVTQQAYSANSKIITTANSMMQDVMNIVR